MLHKLSSMLNNKTDDSNHAPSNHPFSLRAPNQNRSTRQSDSDYHDPFDFFLPRNHSKDQKHPKQSYATRDEEEDVKISEENSQNATYGTIQEIMKVVETAMPLIEEYGPMIKKIPSLFSSFKKSSDKK